MATIDIDAIPDLAEEDVMSAKKWFEAIAVLGMQFHADDPVDDFIDENGRPAFTAAAAAKVNETMQRLHSACWSWPDPEFIYSLAGEGTFGVEKDYPGFIIDCSIPEASRLGYVSVPGQDLPTVVVEDMSEFVAVQVSPATGKLSEATSFRVVPLSGVRFSDGGVDVSGIGLRHQEAVVTSSLAKLQDAIQEVIQQLASARAARI